MTIPLVFEGALMFLVCSKYGALKSHTRLMAQYVFYCVTQLMVHDMLLSTSHIALSY